MYDNDLRRRILEYPVSQRGCQNLCIVSGYAEPSMVSTHLDDVLAEYQVNVRLLVGMFPNQDWDGRVKAAEWERYRIKLRSFRDLTGSQFGRHDSTFECRYVIEAPQLHTKLYVWLNTDMEPIKAFVGSPNYTLKGLGGLRQGRIRQGEIITDDADPDGCYDYFLRHWDRAQDCSDLSLENRLFSLRNQQ